MEPEFETEEAISRASVVIDCTPKGIGHKNKEQYYSKFSSNVKGFLAQGSESDFGKKYALGINDDALNIDEDQFIQIVSCNTHNISCITNTIALNENNAENLIEGKYLCVRRANDMHQEGGYIPSPLVNEHITEQFGSHHAEDAANLLVIQSLVVYQHHYGFFILIYIKKKLKFYLTYSLIIFET